MSEDEDKFGVFLKKSHDKKYARKKTRKAAFDDFQKWKDGKVDHDTTLPRPPARGKRRKPTT
jgi:hypothetical protein